MDWEVVIGLEVHVQLNTKTKIFCNCSTEFGAPPNTHVCPVCMGQPGVLPVLNEATLEKAVKAGLAMNCEIGRYSKFDRKNYFYPDLPKGYQISQFEYPIDGKGFLDIDLPDGMVKRIGITRAHLEEDAGKLIHVEGASHSLVDLNRAGTPLLEIVSEPDMRSAEEAYYYLIELRNIMKYIGVSDVNMEEGSLRCDANISVRPKGQQELGTKVEIKNMNSFTGVKKAISYEIERQIFAKENGESIVQETRLYDSHQNKTFSMRSKEEANDYRYFPDPDLPPIEVSDEFIEKISQSLPELPRARKLRFKEQYGLTMQDAETLTTERELADYFEETVKAAKIPVKKVSNWVQSEVMAVLNQRTWKIPDLDTKVSPTALAELLTLLEADSINGNTAKMVFNEMIESGQSASSIVEAKGLKQVSDNSALEKMVDEVLANNPKEAERFKNGEQKLMGFFVGQVMKVSKGQANPKLVNQIVRQKLS